MTASWETTRMRIVGGPATDARRFAARLRADLPVIICDETQPGESLAAAADLRRAGTPFAASVCFDDRRARIARAAAALIRKLPLDAADALAAHLAIETGKLVADGKSLREHQVLSLKYIRAIREFLLMGDAVTVRSQTERSQIEETFDVWIRHAYLLPVANDDVPTFITRPEATRTCIWAPHADPLQLAIYYQALANSPRPAIIICDSENPGTPHEFIPLARAHEVLPDVRVVIDTDLSDPGAAIAFAGTGIRICHPATNGADEYLNGGFAYDPASAADILRAVMRARGAPPASLREPSFIADAQAQACAHIQNLVPAAHADDPLVSVIVTTYNRPVMLRRALESLARQTYENIEVLVVNDAGTPVGDIVAEFPFATYIELAENGGVCAAINAGLRHAKGKYLCNIADDDRYYPTHFSYLVHAARESGLAVVHGDAVANFVCDGPHGSLRTTGYHVSHIGDLDSLEVFWGMPITTLTLLIEREAYAKVGDWNTEFLVVNDYEILFRLSRLFDFAHAPVITSEFRSRDDGSTISGGNTERFLRELQQLLGRFTQPGRPLIKERQDRTVEIATVKKRTNPGFFPCFAPLAEPRHVE